MGASHNDSAALVRAIAETSPAMLWMGDAEGRCVFLNAAQRAFWGVNPARLEDFDWTSTVHPEDVGMLAGPFATAMQTRTAFAVEARYKRSDGVYRTMRTEANPRFSETGEFLGMTGVNTDVSDQLAAEARNRLLMGELNHRTKNLLTVVQALARQTAREEAPQQFLERLNQRLDGLAASNDLLVKTDWTGALLEDVVQTQLAFLPEQMWTRVTVSGPVHRVEPAGAQALGMALHELATNSLKHGALRSSDGTVRIGWADLAEGGWTMEWLERGPEAVAAPTSKGFGHKVMVDMVQAALNGQVELDFQSTGLVWRLRV